MAVEAQRRDVARGGLVEDRLRRRPERLALREQDQALELLEVVEARARDPPGATRWLTSRTASAPGREPDRLLAELVDDVVLAGRAGAAGLAVADRRAREVLELQRDVLRDVARPTSRP